MKEVAAGATIPSVVFLTVLCTKSESTNTTKEFNMATSKKTKKTGKSDEPRQPHPAESRTLESIMKDNDMKFRICALIFDLRNAEDQTCQMRLSSTIHPTYISLPYFTDNDANLVLSAVIDDSTVEQAICSQFQKFGEKRSASGDFRPCGPHDMVPVYMEVFGIEPEDLHGVSSKQIHRRLQG